MITLCFDRLKTCCIFILFAGGICDIALCVCHFIQE